jgi:N-acetylglutamate synthase-like GNAT family acetyltransferase
MIRVANENDAATYANWLQASEDINLVDRKVYKYPTCQTVVVERNDEPQLINSFHAVLVMEALAPKPGLTPLQEARALNELFDKIKDVARQAGIKEIVFGCKDERLAKFIEGRGFEKLTFPVFRFKL